MHLALRSMQSIAYRNGRRSGSRSADHSREQAEKSGDAKSPAAPLAIVFRPRPGARHPVLRRVADADLDPAQLSHPGRLVRLRVGRRLWSRRRSAMALRLFAAAGASRACGPLRQACRGRPLRLGPGDLPLAGCRMAELDPAGHGNAARRNEASAGGGADRAAHLPGADWIGTAVWARRPRRCGQRRPHRAAAAGQCHRLRCRRPGVLVRGQRRDLPFRAASRRIPPFASSTL